jgi:hypothetical protein
MKYNDSNECGSYSSRVVMGELLKAALIVPSSASLSTIILVRGFLAF